MRQTEAMRDIAGLASELLRPHYGGERGGAEGRNEQFRLHSDFI